MNIQLKYSIATFVIIITMGAGIFFIADSTISKNYHDAYNDKGKAIVSYLAKNSVDLILLDNIPRLQLLLKNTEQSDTDIVYIFVVSPEGAVYAHTFPGGLPKDLKGISNPPENLSYQSQLFDAGERLIIDAAAPIMHGSLGYVHAGLSLEAAEGKRKSSQRKIFWACTLATLLAITIASWFSRRITRPLSDLVAGAEAIGKGDLDHRLNISGSDEIGVTAKAFNQMAESLKDDISRRLEAENALMKSESLYRTLVENIDMGITLIGPDFSILMANAAQMRLLNKELGQLIHRKCYQVFENRDHICPHCPGVPAMKLREVRETIAESIPEKGEKRTVRLRAFPILTESGQSGGFIKVVEDLSEEVKTRRDLATEKERLAVTLRSIGDGVITTDTSGNIVMMNKIAEKLTGWDNADAVGRPLREVFHVIDERTGEKAENHAEKVLATGTMVTLSGHTKLISRNGMELSIADSGAPILDSQGQILGVVLVFRDITEEIKTENELLKIKKLESVGVLAGGIAHDFNNILAAILGNINLALFDRELSENTRRLLDRAEKASLRATDLTQQLLTFAKGGEPVKEAASLESIIRDSSGFVLHGEKVACRYEIPEDLWLVDIDKGQISQVIQNIVLNASHAMPEGGVITIRCENIPASVPVDTQYRMRKPCIKIDIEDTGVGIQPNLIDKIFDPYFTTKQAGSGLGLAITQSIITKHNGHISVKSTPGKGTVFTIILPASERTEKQGVEDMARQLTSTATKILVMDDDDMVLGTVKVMLEEMGQEVGVAVNGEQAIELYEEAKNEGRPFDLVIMDLTVPGGMGGKEAVREILARDPEAKVLVSSGYSTDPIIANYQDYGFSGAIAKPYRIQELSKAISRALQKK